MNDREIMEQILHKVTGMEVSLSGLKEDVTGLKEDVAGLKADVTGLKEDVASLKADVTGLKDNVSCLNFEIIDLKQRVECLEEKVDDNSENLKNINYILENEILFSIRAIADGHLDLTRKMDDVIKFKGKNELLIVDVNELKIDMIKQKTETNQLRKKVEKLAKSKKNVASS